VELSASAVTDFAELPWHDAVILRVEIDRTDPGHIDELNFGVVAREAVRSAQELPDDGGILRLREKWRATGIDLSKLRCFAIETNSTASRYVIYALDWSETIVTPV
jgi:hypothetical protein